jgi:hypothetical protein
MKSDRTSDDVLARIGAVVSTLAVPSNSKNADAVRSNCSNAARVSGVSKSRAYSASFLFRLPNESFINLAGDFVKPLFSVFSLLSVKLIFRL